MSVEDIQKGLHPDEAELLWGKILRGEAAKTEDVILRLGIGEKIERPDPDLQPMPSNTG